jgi:lipid-A-disaccharide synthase-like uncharacterized protein|tara:strand:+ start:370 stop:564 length:195 start_codon:yes stop_codon:yes gene_type:complete
MKTFKIVLIVLLLMSLLGQIMMANNVPNAKLPGPFMYIFILGCVSALIYSLLKKNDTKDNSERD